MTFHLRPQELGDDDAVLAIFSECFPHFPHGTAEDYRFGVESWHKRGLKCYQYVAEARGHVVGVALVLEIESEEAGLYEFDISVRPPYQRQGVGSVLLERLLGHRLELGYQRVIAWMFEGNPAVESFVAASGFQRNGSSEQQSRLHVPTANLSGFIGIEESLAQSRITIQPLVERFGEPSFMEKVHRIDMESHADVPSSVPWKDVPYDVWLDVVVNGPGRSPRWAWVALDGDSPVGLARLRVFQDRKATNAFTGVRASHRGKGIARALKYKTVDWCRQNGIEYIYTGNETRNTRMLAINQSLGYQPLPRAVEVQRIFEL